MSSSNIETSSEFNLSDSAEVSTVTQTAPINLTFAPRKMEAYIVAPGAVVHPGAKISNCMAAGCVIEIVSRDKKKNWWTPMQDKSSFFIIFSQGNKDEK